MTHEQHTTEGDVPFAFYELPRSWYPFKVEYISEATDEVLQTVEIPGPGAVKVPGQQTLGQRCWVRLTLGDGTVMEAHEGGEDDG